MHQLLITMPIPTARTNENGQINIDTALCNGFRLCVDVCKDFSLKMENGKAVVSENPFFGCFACGQCMAVCPKDAIKVVGRFLSLDDLFPLPKKEDNASYGQLLNLLQRRRSICDFKEKLLKRN